MYISHPDSLGLNAKTFQIETIDGALLNTWVLFPMGEINLETTIVLAYGDAGNMSYWLNQCAILSQRGFTVVMFDYRGFGESSDFSMNPNQLYYDEFVLDLNSVYTWSQKNLSTKHIGIWGLSMGTIMTLQSLNMSEPDFLILEGMVVNTQRIRKRIGKLKNKEILLPKTTYNLKRVAKNSKVKMLIFAGTEDLFTTLKDSNKIIKRKNRKLVEFKGNYLQGFSVLTKNYFGDLYVDHIERFILD